MAINKILLTCILMCSALTSSAQIELDHTFPDGFVNGHFHESNDVIYARSISSGTVGDYTMEFYFYNAEYQSLGSTTFNSSFFTIPQYVTRHLFNLDDTIEFITTTIDGTQIRDINGNVLFE